VEESELLSSKPLIHLESIEDYIGKCNPQNIKSCDITAIYTQSLIFVDIVW